MYGETQVLWAYNLNETKRAHSLGFIIALLSIWTIRWNTTQSPASQHLVSIVPSPFLSWSTWCFYLECAAPLSFRYQLKKKSSKMPSLSMSYPWFEWVSWYRFSKFPVSLKEFERFCTVIACGDVYSSLLDYINTPRSLRQIVPLELIAYYLLQGHW